MSFYRSVSIVQGYFDKRNIFGDEWKIRGKNGAGCGGAGEARKWATACFNTCQWRAVLEVLITVVVV